MSAWNNEHAGDGEDEGAEEATGAEVAGVGEEGAEEANDAEVAGLGKQRAPKKRSPKKPPVQKSPKKPPVQNMPKRQTPFRSAHRKGIQSSCIAANLLCCDLRPKHPSTLLQQQKREFCLRRHERMSCTPAASPRRRRSCCSSWVASAQAGTEHRNERACEGHWAERAPPRNAKGSLKAPFRGP